MSHHRVKKTMAIRPSGFPRSRQPLFVALAAVLVFGLLAVMWRSSGNGAEKFAISGNVILAGEPLAAGTIEFRSVSTREVGGAVVRNGRYSIPRERGLPASLYKVSLFAAAAPTDLNLGAPPGNGPPPGDELIPPEYGAQTQQQVEVKAGGANIFDFDIPPRVRAPTRR